MHIDRHLSGALYVIGGVAAGWVLFQWLSPDTADASAAQPTADPPAPTILVVPVTLPVTQGGDSQDVNGQGGSGEGGSARGGAGEGWRERGSGSSPAVATGQTVPFPGGQLIIAQDGSIIVVGDDAALTANTGAASSSGAVVLNSQGSQVSSGASTIAGAPTATFAGQRTATVAGATGPAGGSTDIASSDPVLNALSNALALQLSGRPVAIAGYEDHSVAVDGNDQIVTYDDSNVFINRDGQINANTGDTDSSGLNAVDVADSVIRSGNHTEDGEGDDEQDGEEEEEPEEEELAGTQAAALAAGAGAGGTDSAVSVDPDASTSATGRNPLVVGADGYDDVSIRSTGNRNIITYDDSNVVIGGTGGVNAQIGDSDTSGTVVMGVRGADIGSGAST